MQTLLASIFVFGLLIFIHELGHFIAAKLAGIRVHEFSLGFGPRFAGWQRGETAYNIRLFPLGGFVRMAGMDPEEEIEDPRRTFTHKPLWQRFAVIFAGPFMNFVLAVFLLALIFMVQGIPVPQPQVAKLVPGKPAERAGFQPGDRIVAIDDRPITSWEQVLTEITSRPNQKLKITVEREGQQKIITVVPEPDEQGRGRIGVYPQQFVQRLGPLPAMKMGIDFTYRITAMMIAFMGQMFTGAAPAELGGPVRVVVEIDRAVQHGIFTLLQLAAFLSINIGLFNLLPIPALDGGRILFLAVELVRGRPVDPLKEGFVHLIGFGILLLLILMVTYNDLLQLFWGRQP